MRPALLKWLAVALCAGGVPQFSWAEGTPMPPRERQLIGADRAAAEARFAERQRACGERFIVTACVDDAKRERRATLSRLRHEQNQLDDMLRKARAAERTETIRKRTDAQAQRAGDGASGGLHERVRRAPDEHRAGQPKDGAVDVLPLTPRSTPHAAGSAAHRGVARAEEEARNRATFDAAQRAAEAHRLEVEERNARRAVRHKPAAPLPLPPGASAP